MPAAAGQRRQGRARHRRRGDAGGVLLPKTASHCVIDGSCRLKGVLGEAVKAFYAVLDRYTLEDISRNRQALGKVLMIRAA